LLQVNDECDPLADTCDDLKGLACSVEVYKCRYTTTTATTTAPAEEEAAGEQASPAGDLSGGTTTTSTSVGGIVGAALGGVAFLAVFGGI